MYTPLHYFAASLLCLLIGAVWMLAITIPVLIGLPVTPDNIVLAVAAALPALVAFIGAGIFCIKRHRA